jgi:hypothetical protein
VETYADVLRRLADMLDEDFDEKRVEVGGELEVMAATLIG